MARVRVHQHVNPLAPFYRQSPKPIVLDDVFATSERPLHLDIGCARGRFILRMAEITPDWNFLGVEIRHQLVDEANRIAAEQGLGNLHYSFCNALLWTDRLIEKIPDDRLKTVTIQFPDPWFKKKHAKRRMVSAELVKAIVGKLTAGGTIFVQTDIEFLAEEMFELFRDSAELREIKIDENPFPIKTEREKAVEEKGLPVYRTKFVKKIIGAPKRSHRF
ncbi:MAG TPA: tRNA (guanosine(46)-N7)-methyltransferase TrmB [Pyrinomonadaceae bacterium]|nr:tRNA (guanosine(46)-N7)-methyltransferase TrmB [Pyrinomonadaceae bacterium]